MELLPCPFCGAGITRVVMNGQTWTGTKYSDPISVSVVHHCDPIEGQPSRQIERIGRDAESAIAAWNRRASPASVPGWKLVPDVPTSTMVLAGEKALSEHDFLRMDSAYCAMLAAAPTPPVIEDRWLPIETAPKDGIEVWCFNGEHCVMRWISGEGYALWVYVDPLLSDADPEPEQPSHWMPLPEAPAMQEDKP